MLTRCSSCGRGFSASTTWARRHRLAPRCAHPHGYLLVRQLVADYEGKLHIVHTPPYDPEANHIERLWRVSRHIVTHWQQRTGLGTQSADAKMHFKWLADNPANLLCHIGSPFADLSRAALPYQINA